MYTKSDAEAAIRAYAMARNEWMPDECGGATTEILIKSIGGAARLYRSLCGYDAKAKRNAEIITGLPADKIDLGVVDALASVAYSHLSAQEQSADAAVAEKELSSVAATLGRRGRAANTEAQKAAARENGKKGGRPRIKKAE